MSEQPELTSVPSTTPEPAAVPTPAEPAEPAENFAEMLSAFEQSHKVVQQDGKRQLTGKVLAVREDKVIVDIGYKIEGVLPVKAFGSEADVEIGAEIPVSIKGRTEEGYYELSRTRVAVPTDWTALEAAFNDKTAIIGTVTAVVKGGVSVDVGVRAFMPASRTGTRDAAEMEKLVGEQVTVRITKLDVADENVIVDRRVIVEEEQRAAAESRIGALTEGDVLEGTVRSLMPYGAFIDLGGMDGLLHVSDISWNRISKPEDVLSVGQKLTVRLLKIDRESKKLSLGLKQLQPEPWQTIGERYQVNQKIKGTVVRLTDFGAFVELEPGIEGMIHISEMAWGKKIRHPQDVLKNGELVEAVILGIKPEERRIALGLKQTVADPWSEFTTTFGVGAQVEGKVTRLAQFGAFVAITEGVEGLVHISEIVADRRLNHPSEELAVGQSVKAQILAIDAEKHQVKLSMKQLLPTSVDEFIADSHVGDVVSGRIVSTGSVVIAELGEGIRCQCHVKAEKQQEAAAAAPAGKVDLSALSSLLSARWKGNAPAPAAAGNELAAGQIRSFRITVLDADTKKIEVELA